MNANHGKSPRLTPAKSQQPEITVLGTGAVPGRHLRHVQHILGTGTAPYRMGATANFPVVAHQKCPHG
ncbi:hypothetical protein Y032_0221g2585 [Ancylostoma ceylanicum]|uniref:Uncharacterized protein n=1 Tax=Ancylostoma ceylanicum TaxID=53326 RepID=A0A016SJ86_9BILA|nr:hypothetical protein Y032_0221g2585 [Ancylostoma ceylanicum]